MYTEGPVKRLLCAFIRNPTEDPSLTHVVQIHTSNDDVRLHRDDVKAALEAVTIRAMRVVEHERKIGFMHDIVHSQLQHLAMPQANFANFNLSSVDLTGSVLWYADFSYAILAFANLSGADLGSANFYHARLYRCNLSGTKFLSNAVLSDQSTGNIVSHNLTQAQLDQAVADPDNPPILDGVIDPDTGMQLIWRGSAPSSDYRHSNQKSLEFLATLGMTCRVIEGRTATHPLTVHNAPPQSLWIPASAGMT